MKSEPAHNEYQWLTRDMRPGARFHAAQGAEVRVWTVPPVYAEHPEPDCICSWAWREREKCFQLKVRNAWCHKHPPLRAKELPSLSFRYTAVMKAFAFSEFFPGARAYLPGCLLAAYMRSESSCLLTMLPSTARA